MEDGMAHTTYGAFEEVVRRSPDRTALIFLGERYTFSKLQDMVAHLAAGLYELGVKREEKVIVYLYNLPQTILAWLALQRLEAIPVMVAPVYTAYDIRYMANDVGAEIIFCMDTNLSYVIDVLDETPIRKVIYTNMVELLPAWKRFFGRGFGRVPKGKIPKGEAFISFRDLMKRGLLASLPAYEGRPEQTAVMLYTGGTTGFPKGVPLSAGLFLYRIREWARAAEAVVPLGQGVSLLAAPLYHVIGQMDGFTPLLVTGEPLIVMPRVVLDALFDHIERYRATRMFAVPALYRMILEHDRLDYYDLSSLKYCGTGGDVLPTEVANRWYKRFGIPLYQGYGATELCGAISLSYASDGVPPEGAAGKISPGSKYRLVDPDTLEPVPPGEPGELLATSPYAVRSYWNKPQETAQCFIEIEGEVWYRTKDIVEVDPDRWLYFRDRSVDLIKHKGYRIAAAEVERVLQEHPAVIAASVVGVPDEKVGERIKAFVVLKEDIKGVSGYELIKWCKEKLAPYKVPQYIEFRDMLPKSKVGKFLRRELREEERRKIV
ncbi:MAG: acyl--CoA ligase [Desulfobacterota bacterium]|nr:acyl--CoA ligase [Thermodesulfobacteriota bacterium]